MKCSCVIFGITSIDRPQQPMVKYPRAHELRRPSCGSEPDPMNMHPDGMKQNTREDKPR